MRYSFSGADLDNPDPVRRAQINKEEEDQLVLWEKMGELAYWKSANGAPFWCPFDETIGAKYYARFISGAGRAMDEQQQLKETKEE